MQLGPTQRGHKISKGVLKIDGQRVNEYELVNIVIVCAVAVL